jgi:hypothetical protein
LPDVLERFLTAVAFFAVVAGLLVEAIFAVPAGDLSFCCLPLPGLLFEITFESAMVNTPFVAVRYVTPVFYDFIYLFTSPCLVFGSTGQAYKVIEY